MAKPTLPALTLVTAVVVTCLPACAIPDPAGPAPAVIPTTPGDLATVDRNHVLGRLGLQADSLARKGWVAARGLDHTPGTLAPGATRSFVLPLVAGYAYRALGACGRDCANLDLSVADPAGLPVAQDRRADGVPVLAFRAQATGNYVLTVRMANCNLEACTYGLAFYASPRPD